MKIQERTQHIYIDFHQPGKQTNLENSCTNYVAGPLRQSGLLQNLSRYTTLILNSRHNASLSEDNEGRRARRRFNFDHNLHKFTICQYTSGSTHETADLPPTWLHFDRKCMYYMSCIGNGDVIDQAYHTLEGVVF